jgi:hypothetical protein
VYSIHADDEFGLKIALERELDDVVPPDGLAAMVIARHRGSRRRRVVGAIGLVVAFVGIGVPAGLASAAGGAPSGSSTVALHLASYTLRLPGGWRLADGRAGPCAAAGAASGASSHSPSPSPSPGGGLATAMAMASSGGCVLMLLTSPFSPGGAGDPNIPRGARKVPLGRYQAWGISSGYSRSSGETGLVIEGPAPGGQIQDLVIGASGLSQAALVSLVSANLSKAA